MPSGDPSVSVCTSALLAACSRRSRLEKVTTEGGEELPEKQEDERSGRTVGGAVLKTGL